MRMREKKRERVTDFVTSNKRGGTLNIMIILILTIIIIIIILNHYHNLYT